MTQMPRPSKRCIHPGCTDDATTHSRCPHHHATYTERKWATPTKRTGVYHSPDYHRERQAVKRDRYHCHLSHLGGCNGSLHYHSTRPPSHHRSVCAFLCQRHHMQLEAQGKSGQLATALAHVMRTMGL